MSAAPVSSREFLIRVARAFAVALFFLCAGPLVEFAVTAMLMAGYAVFSAGDALFSGETYERIVNFIALYGGRLLWPTLVSLAPLAGLTGLLAGTYGSMFGRVNARAMLAVSLVVALTALAVFVWRSAPVLSGLFDRDPSAVWFFLQPVLTRLFCFVVSMMACWKLIDIARDRIPAVGRLLGQ
jgi:hypothetical protein